MKTRSTTPSQKPQSARFIEAAKKAGVDECGKAFDKAMRKVVKRKKPS